MKNKQIIFVLFLFVLMSVFALTPLSFNVQSVHADSNSDEEEFKDDDFFSESDEEEPSDVDEDDDRSDKWNRDRREKYKYENAKRREYKYEDRTRYDGALGIPTRIETKREIRKAPKDLVIFSEKERMRDFDRNETVGWSDLRMMFTNWGDCRSVLMPTPTVGLPTDVVSARRDCIGDTNRDGTVDILDMEEIIDSWTEGNDEDRSVAKEIIESCRSVIGTESQRNCLLKTFQNKEVDLKTRRATISWQPRTDENLDNDDERERRIEKRVSNYLKHMGNMVTRMYATVERLEVLSQRIDSRINKLEEDGKDMSRPKALLDDVEGKIDSVRSEISALVDNYENIIEVTNPKESFERIKSDIRKINTLLKDIHRSLIEVISSIKASLSESVVDTEKVVDITPITTN